VLKVLYHDAEFGGARISPAARAAAKMSSYYRQHFANACSAKRRYLSYSENNFEDFRTAQATRCTDGGEIWHGGVGRSRLHSSVPNFTPIGATIRV